MKKIILFILILNAISIAQKNTSQIILQNTSKLNFNETIEYITNEAVKKGWKVPIVHDLQKSVSKAGYNVKPVKVVELCNPHFASKILEDDQSKLITPLMPLRISVYKMANGDVVIARFNPEMVSTMFGDIAEEILLDACATSEEIVSDIIY